MSSATKENETNWKLIMVLLLAERWVISLKPFGDISTLKKWKLWNMRPSLFDFRLNSFQHMIAYIWIRSGRK